MGSRYINWLYDSRTGVFLVFFYFIGNLFTIFNQSFYLHQNKARYGNEAVDAHLAFTVIGGLVFVFWSALHWTWAAKYVETKQERLRRIGYGIWGVFLTHDLPLFIIEWHMVLCCGGIKNGWQGVSFVFLWFTFLISFVWAWTNYTWRAAKWCNIFYGEDTDGVTFVTRGELEEARRSASPPNLPMYEYDDTPTMSSRRVAPTAAARSPYFAPPEPAYVSRKMQPQPLPRGPQWGPTDRDRVIPRQEVDPVGRFPDYDYDSGAGSGYDSEGGGRRRRGAPRTRMRREADAFDRDGAQFRSPPERIAAPYGGTPSPKPQPRQDVYRGPTQPMAAGQGYSSNVGVQPPSSSATYSSGSVNNRDIISNGFSGANSGLSLGRGSSIAGAGGGGVVTSTTKSTGSRVPHITYT